MSPPAHFVLSGYFHSAAHGIMLCLKAPQRKLERERERFWWEVNRNGEKARWREQNWCEIERYGEKQEERENNWRLLGSYGVKL